MKVVEPNCPRCGAPLTVSPGQTQVTCTYCDLTSLIERDKAPVSPRSDQVPTVYIPNSNVKPVFLTFALVGLGVLISGAVALITNLSVRTKTTDAPPSSPLSIGASMASRIGFFDRPMLADVNRDGHVDIVGKCSLQGTSEQSFICAFDGKTGAKLWTTEILTKDQLESYAVRAIVGDKVISVDQLGKVQAYELVSGNPAWTSLISDRAERICEIDGQAVVTAKDESVTGFALVSGAKQSLRKDTRCRDVYSNDDDKAPGYRIIGWWELEKLGLPGLHSIEGLSAHRALVPSEGNIAFLYGSPSQGTSVATVAAVSKKKVLWKGVVPGVEPLRTTINVTTQKAAYVAGRLVMPYEMQDSNEGFRVAALEAASGRRLWDVELYKHRSLQGISICPDTVYFSTWSTVYALNLADGKQRFHIGPDQ